MSHLVLQPCVRALNWGPTVGLNTVSKTYSWSEDRCTPFSSDFRTYTLEWIWTTSGSALASTYATRYPVFEMRFFFLAQEGLSGVGEGCDDRVDDCVGGSMGGGVRAMLFDHDIEPTRLLPPQPIPSRERRRWRHEQIVPRTAE
ncbi:hypothetical protein MSAN_00435800 [Mycena sanguinolenta]|uniref:Uncharacterized protein n=1 Tax=Mycena sanguinolenta TaxID=230812 RepID=A0A8H7DKB9_9AGAR|nr:hypothetical protein MSAN_00435800 [Mycena sanguinolenta]